MAQRHAYSQPIETYGLAHTIETYGHTIAGRRRRRHAWPILLFVLVSPFYSLLLLPLPITNCHVFKPQPLERDDLYGRPLEVVYTSMQPEGQCPKLRVWPPKVSADIL